MPKGNFSSGPGSRRGRPKGSKSSPYTVPLVTRITKEAAERLNMSREALQKKMCAVVSDALLEFEPMKPRTVTRKIKKTLADIGVEIAAGSAADRNIKQVAQVGAEVLNAGQKVALVAKKQWSEAADSLRESIHEATKPKKKKR